MRKLILTTGMLLLAQAAFAAEAGKIIFVAGGAQVLGKPAVLNGAVNEGELLSTGADGYIYIKTLDDGLFILRPNTQARIAAYHVDAANPANTRIKLELLSGVARSQSGRAVKLARQNFRFNTPVAAIGVRGTDFTVFTDQDVSRVAVISGGITISGFAGACRPEGSGPCEGNTSRELTAAQKGQLLQVQRGQLLPQLVQGNNSLAPDVVAPPRGDEPGKPAGGGTAATEPSLDPKKNLVLQQEQLNQLSLLKPPSTLTPEPVVDNQPIVEPAKPPMDVTWGRWTTVADQPPTSGLSKSGAERLAMTEDYVLFRNRSGAAFVTPVQGSVAFNMAGGEVVVRDINTQERSGAALQRGSLAMNFDTASFATAFDVVTPQSETFRMANQGRIGTDGVFSATNRHVPGANLNITGALRDLSNATYLFQGSLDNHRAINGVTVWTK